MLGSVQLQKQHDENAVVGQLLEFSLADIMILDQNPNNDSQHLMEECRRWSCGERMVDFVHQLEIDHLPLCKEAPV